MKRLLNILAKRGRNNPPHLLLLTLALTAVFMLATASEVGPVAPIIISLAMYLIVFCSTAWSLVLICGLARLAAKKYLDFSHAKVTA